VSLSTRLYLEWTGSHVTWNDVTLPQVTGSDPEVTSLTVSKLGLTVEARKLEYTLSVTSYKAVAPMGRQSRDRKWRHVTSGDRKWHGSDIDRKSPGTGCRRLKTHVYCGFHFLQGCSSHGQVVTWQEMTSRDLMWPEVTRKWRNFTGSHQEVPVEGRKIAYTETHF